MALTNAERQARWRDQRNSRANVLADDAKPKEMAEGLLIELGVDRARKVLRALDKRLRGIKSDCPACKGTGFIEWQIEDREGGARFSQPCDCGPKAAAHVAPPPDHSWRVIATTPDGRRWQNGVRLVTEEEAREYADVHARGELEGYVTAEVLRCDEQPRNSIDHRRSGRVVLIFTDGECGLLHWKPLPTRRSRRQQPASSAGPSVLRPRQ
jgi:hypothetical protein